MYDHGTSWCLKVDLTVLTDFMSSEIKSEYQKITVRFSIVSCVIFLFLYQMEVYKNLVQTSI